MTRHAAAVRYARALFDVALREANVETVGAELSEFATLIGSHEALAHVFANPAIPAARKSAVVQAVLEHAGAMSPPLSKLIRLLADRDRLVLIPDLATAYQDRLLDHQKVVRGSVTAAVPLDDRTLRALEQGLARATGRKVLLESRVDTTIIGGVITRLGSTVYDGSVTTQLTKMKEALIQGGRL